uniref:Uncharacterized protein n=1 Tax=Peronospora matthiolae TaxID=2874970 RepID=A0AAV1TB46_9STRA
MLRKGYRELMVLGLLSLGLKLLKEVPGINAYSKTMLAFQVADLTIFILALALIPQATVVFLQLRKHNIEADRIELITAQDLINAITPPAGTPRSLGSPSSSPVVVPMVSCWSSKLTKGSTALSSVCFTLFYGALDCRSSSLLQVPSSSLPTRSRMIEVEPSMWVLLLAVAWMICGFLRCTRGTGRGSSWKAMN